jgi:hypothetical protein
LAKFKKKKSKPTEGSDDPKKELSKEEISDIPEIEGKASPKAPSAEPAINEAERDEKDRKLNKLFWMRVALAIIAGAAATFIFEDIEGEERRWSSIGFMIILFFVTIMVAKGMKMRLPRSDRKKLVTQGIGSYIFMYLFTWILTYTLVNAGSISNEIPSLIN